MKTHRLKQCLALLLSLVLLALCAGGALAAGPSAKTSVSGYTLQKTETSSGGVTLTYQGTGGQVSVYYTTEAKAAQQLGVRQFSGEVLLYDCYGADFDSNSIGTVYYTMGACTVEVRSVGGRMDKNAMRAFLEGIQASPMPVAVGVCPKCGGDLYSHGAQIGAWKEGSSSVCSHGGTVKYKDTQNERSVRVTLVCAACGHKVEDAYTQSALYCSYGNRWMQ